VLLCVAAPAWAQLGYQPGAPASAAPGNPKTDAPLPTVVKKTRTTATTVRPDWYALFLLWAKSHPNDVLAGLRDPKNFDNFTQFLACDWVRDWRQNDIAWPARQTQIVQKFNERTLNPQMRFKLLTRGVLGPYVPEQQQFVFHPLDGTVFGFEFPADKLYGMEDDCAQNNNRTAPEMPWPREFILGFQNPGLISVLPLPKDQAEVFISNLPKDAKGELDRHVVLEVELDVTGFEPEPLKSFGDSAHENSLPPIGVLATARGAVVYADAKMTKELARYGAITAPAGSPAPPK
jgi:hypothetical protein